MLFNNPPKPGSDSAESSQVLQRLKELAAEADPSRNQGNEIVDNAQATEQESIGAGEVKVDLTAELNPGDAQIVESHHTPVQEQGLENSAVPVV